MTRGRGRGRPPGSGKNQRATMDPALRAAIAGMMQRLRPRLFTNVPEVSQNRSTSTQVTQSQPSQSQPSQNQSKSKSKSAVKRLKPAINAAELTKQNYDLFARALESKCNNQF
jgi:hypothetical protein